MAGRIAMRRGTSRLLLHAAAALASMTRLGIEQSAAQEPAYSSVPCAAVHSIRCRDAASNQESFGFTVTNNCGLLLHYQYRSHNRTYRTTADLRARAPDGTMQRHCPVTSFSDYSFLNVIVDAGRDYSPQMSRIRRLAGSNSNREDSTVTKAMVEAALDFDSLPTSGSRQQFTERVHEAYLLFLRARSGRETRLLTQHLALRNAEYYVMGLHAGLSGPNNSIELSIAQGSGAYMAYKWAVHNICAQFGETARDICDWPIRTNPDIPTTPPGGSEWAKNGLWTGRNLFYHWQNTPDAVRAIRQY